MMLQMPVFLILFGAEASALQNDIAASLAEYLDVAEARGVTFWRVDADEPPPAALPGGFSAACHDLRWQDMQADGYIETAFSIDYQRVIDGLIDPTGHQFNCYAGVVVSGAQVETQALGELHRRLDAMLEYSGRRLRSHLIWLMEDRVTHLSGNHRMLSEELESPRPALGLYQRVTVLSAGQMNGSNSFATRRQRLDAIAPCVLETVNAAALDGAKVQTVAYRKLNCTSAEIRRLMGQRVNDEVWAWLLGPMDTSALWELFSTPELAFSDYIDQEPGLMAQSLIGNQQALLPGAADMLVVTDSGDFGDPVAMVEAFQQNNEEALLAHFSGDAWAERWLETVEARLRRCLNLRTVLAFIARQGPMRARLAAMADETVSLARGHDYRFAQPPQGGWFERRRYAYAGFVAAADEYLRGLACRILHARLRRMQQMMDRALALCDAMLRGVEEAFQPYRLPAELEKLYHALAEPYDKAIGDALGRLTLSDDAILGGAQVFYPADEAAMNSLWRGIHRRLMERVAAADAIFTQGFCEAYALGKEPFELETDICNSLSTCSWQLSGGTVADTDVAVYYAAACICGMFPANRLGGEPLRRIPGDMVAYLRFGAAADTLADLKSFIPFRTSEGYKLNDNAVRAMQAKRETPAAEAPPPECPALRKTDNPWHIRLDERNGRFTLYWVWPNGSKSDAQIQITRAGGDRAALSCSHDVYSHSMGCGIPAEKIGFGMNTVTVLHGQQAQTVRAMGRRVAVHYQSNKLSRRKTVVLGQEKVTLNLHEVSYEIDDPLMGDGLRLMRRHSASPLLCPLPVFRQTNTGRYVARFYTSADKVELCATAEQESMLDIHCD